MSQTSTTGIEDELPSPNLLSALPQVLWQRRWLIILPTVLATAAGGAAAWLLPPIYESSATVLIESQQLPDDLVNSPVTNVIDQRIARARERVLSRQDLIRLIRSNDLYPKEQKTKPLSTIVDKMRDATTITAVGSDLAGQNAYGNRSTIALRIAFDYSDPTKAQLVAQQYVNRFLEVDASAQTDQAVGAATFLNEQGNELQSKIAAIETKITGIKAANGPLLALQAQTTGDPTADAARIDGQIAALRAEVTRLSAGNNTGPDPAITAAETALRAAQARYSDTHPDVIAAKAQLDAARRSAVAVTANPLDPQIAADKAQISALQSARSMLLSQSSTYRAAQARGPAIAAQVDQLEKQADVLRDQYRALGSKVQNAQVSAKMQTEQKGERLTLADPPVVPDRPSKPNRPMLVAGSIAAGIGIGLALALLFELLLRPIRGTEALRDAAGAPPLVIVPDFDHKPNLMIRWLEKFHRRRTARA